MIGNEKDALFIHDWYHSKGWGKYDPPEGWQYMGGGSYRSAYLSPDGVVYKVQMNLGNWLIQTNYSEYQTWKRLYFGCKMPKYSRLPRLSYYAVPGEGDLGVIAIEPLSKVSLYRKVEIDKCDTDLRWFDVADKITRVTGVQDLYGPNLMLDTKNNLLVPTDLGLD